MLLMMKRAQCWVKSEKKKCVEFSRQTQTAALPILFVMKKTQSKTDTRRAERSTKCSVCDSADDDDGNDDRTAEKHAGEAYTRRQLTSYVLLT